MEITQERLEREYHLDLIVASPGVAYQILLTSGETILVDHPSRLPETARIGQLREPVADVTIVAPDEQVGGRHEVGVGQSRGSEACRAYRAAGVDAL